MYQIVSCRSLLVPKYSLSIRCEQLLLPVDSGDVEIKSSIKVESFNGKHNSRYGPPDKTIASEVLWAKFLESVIPNLCVNCSPELSASNDELAKKNTRHVPTFVELEP